VLAVALLQVEHLQYLVVKVEQLAQVVHLPFVQVRAAQPQVLVASSHFRVETQLQVTRLVETYQSLVVHLQVLVLHLHFL
jgi:hypothetical protein